MYTSYLDKPDDYGSNIDKDSSNKPSFYRSYNELEVMQALKTDNISSVTKTFTELDQRADNLNMAASTFEHCDDRVPRRSWFNMKTMIVVGLIIIIIIFVSISLSLTKRSSSSNALPTSTTSPRV